MDYEMIRLKDRPELMEHAAEWFHKKWGIPLEAYKESMNECLTRKHAVPQWYVAMEDTRIIGGMGVIDNDFHDRKDLAPNVCAVYTEEDKRGQGIAGQLLDFVCRDMRSKGIDTLYLVTDHTSFYERYGWEFLCMVQGDGEPDMSRMYVHTSDGWTVKEGMSSMDDLPKTAKEEIEQLWNSVPEGKHIKTGDIRKLSAKLFRKIPTKDIKSVFDLCEQFLEEHNWEFGVIAFDWAFRMKEQYNKDTYLIFYSWLKKYVRGWGDCDDFCTHAFGELLRQDKLLFSKILEWTSDPDFWVRRASAVILIPAILHHDLDGIDPFLISDRLMNDENDLVLKGYGWMLKAVSQTDQSAVEKYLIKNHSVMPRVAFRYALEKFDKETRGRLMAL